MGPGSGFPAARETRSGMTTAMSGQPTASGTIAQGHHRPATTPSGTNAARTTVLIKSVVGGVLEASIGDDDDLAHDGDEGEALGFSGGQ